MARSATEGRRGAAPGRRAGRGAALAALVLLVCWGWPSTSRARADDSRDGPAPAAGPASTPAGAAPLRRRPVDGRRVRPFQAPDHPYGPGHRGVDLAAAPGAPVVAAGRGVVAFAGRVAGRRWVTIDHGADLRTTYGPLRSVGVERGASVAAGTRIGTAGAAHGTSGRLHWSARRGERYVDPTGLLVRRWRPTLLGAGGWRTTDTADVPGYRPWDGRHRLGLVPDSPVAQGPGWVTAPNPNRVIGLAGLGSAHGTGPLELTHLGYAPDDVTAFSYAGVTADGRPRDHGAEATWRGVEAAADRLDAHLRAQWRREPGRAVDLVGHSLGGVVAVHYLMTRYDPTDPGLPPIAHVATIASPLEGADAAAAVSEVRSSAVGRLLVDAVAGRVRGYEPGARSVSDLGPGSAVVTGLGDAWRDATADRSGGPLATGTRVATFGASQDVVVPEHRSDLPGAPHAVLPGTHDGVRRSQAARIALRAFLAGDPVPGESGGWGWLLSHPTSWVDEVAAVPVHAWPPTLGPAAAFRPRLG